MYTDKLNIVLPNEPMERIFILCTKSVDVLRFVCALGGSVSLHTVLLRNKWIAYK